MCPWGNGLMCTTIVQHRRIPIVFVSRVVEDADPLLFEKLGTSVTRHRRPPHMVCYGFYPRKKVLAFFLLGLRGVLSQVPHVYLVLNPEVFVLASHECLDNGVLVITYNSYRNATIKCAVKIKIKKPRFSIARELVLCFTW